MVLTLSLRPLHDMYISSALRVPVVWPFERGSLGTLGVCFCPEALAEDAGVRPAEGVPRAGAAWRLPKAMAPPWAPAPASLPLRLPCKANCPDQAMCMHVIMSNFTLHHMTYARCRVWLCNCQSYCIIPGSRSTLL